MRRTVLIATFTATTVLAWTPATAGALTKAEADAVAMNALNVRQTPGLRVLFGMPRPLRAGTVVTQAGPARFSGRGIRRRGGRITERRRTSPLRRAAWLYWLDEAPKAGFVHPSVLLLVDDRTGAVVRRESFAWWPLINGRRPPFLRPGAYDTPSYQVFANISPPADPAPARTRGVAAAPPLPARPDVSGHCMVIIGDRVDPIFDGDFPLARQVARTLRLPYREASTLSDLYAQIRGLSRRPTRCHDVVIFIAGHGAPAPGGDHPGTTRPSVTLKTRLSPAGDGSVYADTLSSTDLRRVMRRFKGLTFKFVIQACFSGRFLDPLGEEPNARFVATSSAANQFSYAYFEPQRYWTGEQRNGVIVPGWSWLNNTTTNHTRASPFVNGFFRGLLKWGSTPDLRRQTGDDFLKGLVTASSLQHEQNFAEQLGWTTAGLNDLTSRGSTVSTEPSCVIEESTFGPVTDDRGNVYSYPQFVSSGRCRRDVLQIRYVIKNNRIRSCVSGAGKPCRITKTVVEEDTAIVEERIPAGQSFSYTIETDKQIPSGSITTTVDTD